MKTIGKVGLILLFIVFFIGCATRDSAISHDQTEIQEKNEIETEIPIESIDYFAFDFDTDQSVAPFADYGAAYIINASNETIYIPISTWGNSTMFSHFYYDESGIRPIFTEMMLARINRNRLLVLEPGSRVLAFSVAFFRNNLDLYPDALYDARIYVNNNPVNIRGYIRR